MIKFFRKIRQKLLTENKFSKYLMYAIGEIALVMIGILLALQVNEWNNERNREIKEQAIIERLHADLIKSRLEIEEMERFFLRQARSSAAMSRAFWNAELRKDAKKYVFGAWGNRTYSPTMGTVRSLINSGNIDVLSSVELKSDIVSYVERVDYLLEDIRRYEETYYRKGVDLLKEAIPNTVESIEYFNESTNGNPGGYELNLHGRPKEIDRVPFQSDWDELFEDVRLFRGYEALRLSHWNIYRRYGDMLESTNELLAKINQSNNSLAPDASLSNAGDHYLVFDSLDLEILQQADALLSDSTKWNKEEDRNCQDDMKNERYSLYCALYKAIKETKEEFSNEEPALRIINWTIKKYENRRVVGRTMEDWNNHPKTTFEELKKVLKESIDEVKKQLQ